METILITGINGYLGSSLAKKLSKYFKIVGTEVSVDNLFRIKDCNFRVYLTDPINIERLFNENKINYIIHTATFYGRGEENYGKLINFNLYLPIMLIEKAALKNIKLFINTDTSLEKFVSAYSLSKSQFKDWLFILKNKIKIVNLKLEHFYGPGASEDNFISFIIKQMLNNVLEINLTPGEQKRDFIYLDDVVEAYYAILLHNNSITSNYSEFEVGSGEAIKIGDIVKKIKILCKSSSKINFGAIKYRENEIMFSKANIKSLMNFNWEPKTKIDDGLVLTINKMR